MVWFRCLDISMKSEICATLISMQGEMNIEVLKALSDPTRLRIVQFLANCCCDGATVQADGGVISPSAGDVCCHITGQERISSTISHHLSELKAAGVIEVERHGKYMRCRLRPETLQGLGRQLISLSGDKS